MTIIRRNLDHFLSRYDETEHSAILRGALVATYLSDEASDAVLWLVGAKTEHGHAPGMAQRTIQALRDIGLLDELGATAKGGVIRYPGTTVSEPTFKRSIGINAVWFHWYCRQQAAQGKPIPKTPGDIPKADAKAAKVHVTELAYTHLQNFPVTIRHTTYTDKQGKVVERLGAFTEAGNLLGLITPDSETYFGEGQQLTLKFAIAADGNLRAVWK